ncbi:MAG: hypothetical protein ACR2OO_17205 [Thermomicrobiales bacterium]
MNRAGVGRFSLREAHQDLRKHGLSRPPAAAARRRQREPRPRAVARFAAHLDTGRAEVRCPACGAAGDFRGRSVRSAGLGTRGDR